MREDQRSLEVKGSPTRCPYCHNEVSSNEEVVACVECLARHHGECWNSHGTCATCGCARRLEAPSKAPTLTDEIARHALVRAGFAAAEVDALFKAKAPPRLTEDQLKEEKKRRENLEAMKVFTVLGLGAGAGFLAAFIALSAESNIQRNYAPLVGLGVGLLVSSFCGLIALSFSGLTALWRSRSAGSSK